MSILPLSENELRNQAPALFTEEPHFDVSDKYRLNKKFGLLKHS